MRALPSGGAFGDGLPIDPSLAATAAIASAEPLKPDVNQTSKMIDLAQVQGQVHAQSVQKVGEIADKNPTETVSIIRQWLHESAAA
jgi:flagellar M-ring protein FliF